MSVRVAAWGVAGGPDGGLPALRPAELDAHIAAANAAPEIAAGAQTPADRIIPFHSKVGAPG